MEIIESAIQYRDEILDLLLALGNADTDQPLFHRMESVAAEPWDLEGDKTELLMREELFSLSAKLSQCVDRYFLTHDR